MNEEKTIMRDQLRALSAYIGRPDTVQSPFLPGLTEKLLPSVAFQMPSFQSFTIERKYHDKNVRVVTAFEAAPIEAARMASAEKQPAKRRLLDWSGALRTHFLAQEDDFSQCRVLSQFGATRGILAKLRKVDVFGEHVDFLALRTAEAAWRDERANSSACESLLELDPIFAPAWIRLADLEAQEGCLTSALAADLLAGVVKPDVGRIARRVNELDEACGSTVWGDFGKLYESFQGDEIDFGGKASFWRAVRGTAGRVMFKSSDSRPSDHGAFTQAKALFRSYKGKDVQKDLARAMALLVQSIESDPSDPEKWRYYAAAHRAAKRPREAALAYLQTLTLNPDDTVAASDLILMYEELGFKQLAEGDAWWLLMTVRSDDPVVKKAIEIIRRHHEGVFAD